MELTLLMKSSLLRILLFFTIIIIGINSAQSQVVVAKSSEIQLIEGKRYYIHTIEQGQTVYSIAKAYDLTVDEIYYENPEAKNGLQIGAMLNIPAIGRDKEISDELRSNEYNFIFHIVQRGETLYSIGRIYDVKVDELEDVNPEAKRGLKIGQYVKIPVKNVELADEGDVPADPLTEGKLIEHEVVAGETLFSIAQQYKLSVDDIKAVNPGMTKEISVGDIVYIPFGSSQETVEQLPYIEHTVKAQETLYGIAVDYGVSIDSIKMLNPGLTSSIGVGQLILIPKRNNQNDYITHQVKRKSRLSKIARMYSLDIDEIREINPSARNKVSQGTILRIPIPPMAGLPAPNTEQQEIPPEVYKLVDADSIRCHQDHNYEDLIFNVALMLPLYLEEVDSLPRLSSRSLVKYEKSPSFNFIQFYEGFMIAVDSLRKQGLNIELHVYDVDEQVANTIKVLQDPALMEMDLIIGPLFRKNFKLVSNYAKLFDIKIVNPLTTRDEVLDYRNVFKVKPSQHVQLSLVDQLVKANYPDAKIVIVRHNQFQFGEMTTELRDMLERGMHEKVQIANYLLDNIIKEYSILDTTLADGELLENLLVEDVMVYREFLEMQMEDSTSFQNRVDEVVYTEEGIDGIMKKSSIVRPTVIVAISDKKVFALELLTQLNEFRDSLNLTLIGFPDWYTFSAMETEYLQNLNTIVFSDSYIDYAKPEVISFIKEFRQRYNTEPMRYAYDGFDIAYYFLGVLLEYGKHFENCIPYYEEDLYQNKYLFRHKRNKGFENQHWNVLRYHNYSIQKLN